MTREEVVELVGEEWVAKVEAADFDFTNRVTSGTDWDGYCEFMASVDFNNGSYVDFEKGTWSSIIAYCYQKEQDVDKTEDLGSLDWGNIDHYDLV